ncbi:hypothetical protein ACFYOC_25530 [Nocardiopsis alba]|uniref:hypothetical protein n=1 Tax=Nocardiopsis alba TaxID=53437 RepID=UPI0036ACC4DC
MTLPELVALAEAALPVFTLTALAGTAVVTWLLAGETARRRARIIRRLRADLAAERELVARLAGPTAALLQDVRGAHHCTTEETDRG